MDRRAFITTIGLTVLATRAACAQQPTKTARIGFLVTATIGSPVFLATADPFWRGLRDLGYIEGRNLLIEYRSADGKQERFPSLANDLVRVDVDLILAGSTPHALAARQATRTIPSGCRRTRGQPRATGRQYHGVELSRPGVGRQAAGTAQGGSSESLEGRGSLASRRLRRTHDERHAEGSQGCGGHFRIATSTRGGAMGSTAHFPR